MLSRRTTQRHQHVIRRSITASCTITRRDTGLVMTLPWLSLTVVWPTSSYCPHSPVPSRPKLNKAIERVIRYILRKPSAARLPKVLTDEIRMYVGESTVG